MTWTRLCDSFYDHPKIAAGGNEVAGAYARSLSYCGRHLTGGRFPKAIGEQIAGRKAIVKKLIELRLWEMDEVEFVIPNYIEIGNPTKEKVEADREAAAARMRALRAGRSPDVRPNFDDPDQTRPDPHQKKAFEGDEWGVDDGQPPF